MIPKATTKLQDVAPVFADLDASIEDLSRATMDDDGVPHGASSVSGTMQGSNDDDDLELVVAENPIEDICFNPFDDWWTLNHILWTTFYNLVIVMILIGIVNIDIYDIIDMAYLSIAQLSIDIYYLSLTFGIDQW